MTVANNSVVVEVGSDPIAWAKKQNKIVYGDIRETVSDYNLNPRLHIGAQFYGVTAGKDSLDVEGMQLELVEGGGILEPLLISVRSDGKKVRLRGNRRGEAGCKLCADPTTSPVLFKALTERTPMILLHGLTENQERELVNDQNQKPFLRTEAVRIVFDLRRNGWSYDKIAMLHWPLLAKFTGSIKKAAEMRAIVDPQAKKQKILTWMRGTLDNYLIWGFDCGAFIQKCIMLSVMATDGMLTDNQEKAYFNTEKNPQKRIAAIREAIKLDGAKHDPFVPKDGSEFKKVLDQFHAEDYGTTVINATGTKEKMLTRKDVEAILGSFQSNLSKQLLNRVLGKQVEGLDTLDIFAAICQSKQMLVETYLPHLKPEVASIVRLCFVNPDPTDFQKFLEANRVESEVESNPVTEVSQESVAV